MMELSNKKGLNIMPAKIKPLAFTSYPTFEYPIIGVNGIDILQLQPNTNSSNEDYNYKESDFFIPNVSVAGGYIEGDNVWLMVVSSEELLKVCNIFIYKDKKTLTNEIEKAQNAFKKSLIGAVLVNNIPSWKYLAILLAEKKVLIKPKSGRLKANTDVKEEDIKLATTILSCLIDVSISHNTGNILSSTSAFNSVSDDEQIANLADSIGKKGTEILATYSRVFTVLELLIDESNLLTRQKQEEVGGELFDSDETEIVCFPYIGSFPNNIQLLFNSSKPSMGSSSGKGGYGGNNVTVQGYDPVTGKQNFILNMQDEELRRACKNIDNVSFILICLSLSGVNAIPSNITPEISNTQQDNANEDKKDNDEDMVLDKSDDIDDDTLSSKSDDGLISENNKGHRAKSRSSSSKNG